MALDFAISNIFTGDADADALGTTVENHFLFYRSSLIKQEKTKILMLGNRVCQSFKILSCVL